jgi:N-acetylmuramoyl-L-alanine amidase
MTPILGKSPVTVSQALSYAQSILANMNHCEPVFLTYWYLAAVGHPVRADVAAAQSLMETARFNFGRMVTPEYCNPSGCRTAKIFANEGEVPANHERFKDWADGCAAHMDHLALYAGAFGYPARGQTRDPRHFPYLKGTCTTVERLGVWTGGANNTSYGLAVLRHMEGMAER